MLQDGPPLQDLLDPDVELVEPDEGELRARQALVVDLAAAKSPRPALAAAASAQKAAAERGGEGGGEKEEEEEEEIIDLT